MKLWKIKIKVIWLQHGDFKMTITKYDKFAFIPIRCSKCNRLFIFEWYNLNERDICPIAPPLKVIKCKNCCKQIFDFL